jgi:hypothetical protein
MTGAGRRRTTFECVRACKLCRVSRRSVIHKRAPHTPTWENAGKDHHRRRSPLGINIRRARGKDSDIGEVLGAEYRPEPCGPRGAGHPRNGEVVLFSRPARLSRCGGSLRRAWLGTARCTFPLLLLLMPCPATPCLIQPVCVSHDREDSLAMPTAAQSRCSRARNPASSARTWARCPLLGQTSCQCAHGSMTLGWYATVTNGAHALACLLGSPACLCCRGLWPPLDRPPGDRGSCLRQRLHGPAVSSCHATQRPPPLALSVSHPGWARR